MRIDRLELRLLRLPLVHFFETSFGRSYDREFVLVTAFGDGAEGWGECVADAGPFYSSETTETAWHVISAFVAPRVIGVPFEHPREILPALALIRGHNMAKAAVEMAAWDLFARQEGLPLSRVLGGTRARIESGVSIGIQDTLAQLVSKVETETAAGYRRIKIKVKPGWDVEAVRAVRERFGAVPLMADAKTAAEAIELGACRIINVKPGRVGGHAESVRLHDACAARGVPVWHGGMLESGIGRAHNVHLASLPNFSLPGDIAASRRYFVPDLIEPAIDVAPDGTIAVPAAPGIGVTIDRERVQAATLRQLSLP